MVTSQRRAWQRPANKSCALGQAMTGCTTYKASSVFHPTCALNITLAATPVTKISILMYSTTLAQMLTSANGATRSDTIVRGNVPWTCYEMCTSRNQAQALLSPARCFCVTTAVTPATLSYIQPTRTQFTIYNKPCIS